MAQAVQRACVGTSASLQRINVTHARSKLECLGFTPSGAQFQNHAVARHLQLMRCLPATPVLHVRKTRVVSRFCSCYSSEIRLHYPGYLTKILGWCFCIHDCSLSSHFLLRPTNICENNSDLPVEASHDISSHSLYTAIKTLTVKISLTLLLLGPNSRLRTLMSNTINLRSSVHTGDPVSI